MIKVAGWHLWPQVWRKREYGFINVISFGSRTVNGCFCGVYLQGTCNEEAYSTTFARFVNAVSDWIAFVLLALIGANMIKEALSKEEEEEADASLGVKEMFVLAVATSIDAFAVGVSFACMEIGSMIVPAVLFIGVITFSLSAAGVKVGNVFGTKYKAKAELAGGIILILLGVKIILQHFGIL